MNANADYYGGDWQPVFPTVTGTNVDDALWVVGNFPPVVQTVGWLPVVETPKPLRRRRFRWCIRLPFFRFIIEWRSSR